MKRPEIKEVLVFQKREKLYGFLIKKWKEISGKAIKEKGFFTVALSGGETPVEFYQRLADSKNFFSWDGTHFFLADERFVSFEHPDSNYGMIRKDLLARILLPPQNVHPIQIYQTPEISTEKYEEDLRMFFNLGKGEFPEFDLILLGIGAEGHTASLFPGDSALSETHRLTAAVHLNEERHDRVTLTLPVINRARQVIFLVSGEEKSEIMKEVLEKPESNLPASMVKPVKGKLFFLLDKEAGSLLLQDKTALKK